jgi:hypothetical protein
MSLPYGLRTPRDLFEKLKREAAKLDSETSPDNLFNFAVTAWHMQDWIREGPAKSAPTIEADRAALRRHPHIQVCRDIANASKHFTLTYSPTISSVHRVPSSPGAIPGRSGLPMIPGSIPRKGTIAIVVGSDTYDIRQLNEDVVQLYETFLARHGL